MALLATLSEHWAVPGHRLLRKSPRFRPRRADAGEIRPTAPPLGALWSCAAGNRTAVGVVAVATDGGPLPAAYVVPGPAAGRNFSRHVGVAASSLQPEADLIHRGRSALGGPIHPGLLGAVPCRGSARPDPDRAHLPPRIPNSLARASPPNQSGINPFNSSTG